MNTGDNDAGFFYTESAKDAIILERNVKDHPASSIARLLLLGHYKINNDPAFTQFAKQTSLYFNNPYWLQLQLSRLELYKEASISSHPPLSAKTENVLATVAGDEDELKEETIALASSDESFESKDTAEIKNDVAEEEEKHLVVLKNENTERLLPEGHAAPPAYGKEEEETSFEPKEESPAVKEQAETINNNPAEVYEEEGDRHEYKPGNTDTPQPVNNTEATTSAGEKEVAFEPQEEIPRTDQPNNITSPEHIKEPPFAFAAKEEIPETGHPIHPAHNLPAEKNKETIIAFEQTPDIESGATGDTEEGLPAFEPLHTIDYFASQGIKIKEEAFMDDKLGQQMKSFTAWLKSMKKLHPGKLPEQNEVIERIIQSSAEESNADAEVLTEAMAEVLIKQNKEQKAIEMYQKLSLLNPLKSAYFAAKIENIKNK